MKLLARLLAYRRWWREIMSDLEENKERVIQKSQKLHFIAGRAHVLEVEAYGETKPRKTLPPSSC